MIKKILFAISIIFFLCGKLFLTPVFAQVSFEYDVAGGYTGDYLMPHGYHSVWTAILSNSSSVDSIDGVLEATYEPSKFSWIFESPFTKIEDGLLRYNYFLGPRETKTVFWRGALDGSEDSCVPINRVTSYLYNNGSKVATEVGSPLSDIYLTISNQTGDNISVTPYVNGYQNFLQNLSIGENKRVKIWEGGMGGGPLFDCYQPPVYSFVVTGSDPGASYSCSISGGTSLVNNCTSEHTAVCRKGAVTPTPGPGTPTPTPPTCEYCREDENTWCAPNATDCGNAKGRVLSNPCDYCASGTVHCCTPKDTNCPMQMNVKGTYNECAVVEVEVRQDPRGEGGKVDCGCAYSELKVKIISAPAGSGIPTPPNDGYHVCSVGYDSCKKWKSCFWDAKNMQNAPDRRASSLPVGPYPEGRYVLEVHYGGHTPGPGNPCSDPQCTDSDDTTLGPCDIPTFDPSEGCPVGTTKVKVNIPPPVDTHFNSLAGWTKLQGDPGVGGGYFDCCYRSRGSNCDDWGFCGKVRTFDGSNMLRDVSDDCDPKPYTVSARLFVPPETVNDYYLVSVWGTGIKAERTGHEGSDDGTSHPFMKLASGDISPTADLRVAGSECNWQEGTYKMLARESWIDVYLKSKTTNSTHGTHPVQAAFDNLKLYHCAAPVTPTCTVSGPTTVSVNTTVPYCAIATDAPEGAEIWKSPTTSQDWTNIRPKSAVGCSGTSFTQAGTYYVVCNAFGPSIQCSGNPWCPWPPVALPEVSCSDPVKWVDCTANDVLTVTVTIPDPWFQTQAGDVHAEKDIYSKIPSTATQPFFSLKSAEDQSSVVSYTGTANFGQGKVSVDYKWLAKSSYKGKKYGYDYFYKLVGSPAFTSHSGPINQNKIRQDLDSNNNIVAYNGDVETGAEWNLGSRKAVILINGRFLLKDRIRSDVGGSIVIVAKKGIGVSKNVGASGEGGNIIRAAFITDKIFYASVDPSFPVVDGFNTVASNSDKKLVIDGAVIAWENFNLTGRTFDTNSTKPIEFYRYDPAIFLNSNQKLWQADFTWQELAP